MDIPTLAQVFAPPMPSVTPAPWTETWLFGSGLPGAGLLLGLSVIAWFGLSRSGRARLALPVAGLLVLLGVGAFAMGRMTVTLREGLRARAGEVIDAAATADADALTRLLDPQVRVRTRFASAQGRDRVIELTRRARAVIESHSVGQTAVDVRGPRVARTIVGVSIRGDSVPPQSRWALDWQRPEGGDWTVVAIEPLWIQGINDPAGAP